MPKKTIFLGASGNTLKEAAGLLESPPKVRLLLKVLDILLRVQTFC